MDKHNVKADIKYLNMNEWNYEISLTFELKTLIGPCNMPQQINDSKLGNDDSAKERTIVKETKVTNN